MINFKFCDVLFLLLVPRSGSARFLTSVELCSGTALFCTQTELSDNVETQQTSALYDIACADKCSTLYIGHHFLRYIWAYQLRPMHIDDDAGLRHTDVAKFTPSCFTMSISPTIFAVLYMRF